MIIIITTTTRGISTGQLSMIIATLFFAASYILAKKIIRNREHFGNSCCTEFHCDPYLSSICNSFLGNSKPSRGIIFGCCGFVCNCWTFHNDNCLKAGSYYNYSTYLLCPNSLGIRYRIYFLWRDN